MANNNDIEKKTHSETTQSQDQNERAQKLSTDFHEQAEEKQTALTPERAAEGDRDESDAV